VIRSRSLTAAVILALCLTSAQAQDPAVPPALVESVDVRVINIDVVVTDRKGNPVRGLGIDDFLVYENGRQVKLTNFYEVVSDPLPEIQTAELPVTPASPAPVEAPAEAVPDNQKRRIVFYIDNLSMHPFNRNRVFDSMKEFAAETLRPGDEAMIATWNRSMKIRVPFTSDIKHVQQTLDVIAGESAFGVHNISERRQIESQIREARSHSEAVIAARSYAQSVDHDLRQSVSSLNALMGTLAGVEGKKILVLTSEGFPMQPGREIFAYIDDIAREKANTWGRTGSSMIEGMGFNATNVIQSVARTANANGITLYALHAGGLVANSEGSAENARPLSFTAQQAALSNSTDSMHMLASMTGGLATTSTNNFKLAFEKIQRDLSSYYSLGYRSGTERVDRQRTLEVKMKNREYTARARRSFVEKSLPTEMNDRVIANLFYDSSANDMNILFTTRQPVPMADGIFKVPVDIRVPMDNITLFPQGEIYVGGFSIYIVVANKDGDMSDVTSQSHQIRVPASEIGDTAGKFYTYSVDLAMEKGLNKISIGVLDEVSKLTGFQRQQILAADLR
jgi:VWFA-related protein